MTKQLLVLGCSQTKREAPGVLPAIDRYDGSPYRVLRKYLRNNEWPSSLSVAILSAKYGLVGGFTNIENYDERMTKLRAEEWQPLCSKTLANWSTSHSRFHFSLGKDYLPVVMPTISSDLSGKAEIFDGGIGIKLGKIKRLLENTESLPKRRVTLPEAGSGTVKYFLPDWDDLLDSNYDFATDTFSAPKRKERNDEHCAVLMKPKRIFDGVLVSLAQHTISKGPLKRIHGTDVNSLAPVDLRNMFGLGEDQYLFGDCGAFSYVNEDVPSISVEQAIAMYDLHGFDFGASVDHIPILKIKRNGVQVELSHRERLSRIRITQDNAEQFITSAKRRKVSFTPVGIIQALDAPDYAQMAKLYHEFGYRHIAIGGLVPLGDSLIDAIVTEVMETVETLKPRPWIHLFGVFRPKLQNRFRQLRVDSFDSATYFRKAWLRSDQNYLATTGDWYAAIRVPMTKDGRTRKKFEAAGLNIEELKVQESEVMKLLCQYDRDEVGLTEVLDAVMDYDIHLIRASEVKPLRAKYKRTLEDRPWRNCDCPFCREAGIHLLIFRGANRNKRRGTHNTLMLYGSLQEE